MYCTSTEWTLPFTGKEWKGLLAFLPFDAPIVHPTAEA